VATSGAAHFRNQNTVKSAKAKFFEKMDSTLVFCAIFLSRDVCLKEISDKEKPAQHFVPGKIKMLAGPEPIARFFSNI
jgi:hypothetical protein